ncbi:alpha/beta fold hydrolase [Actinomadura sp. B10D3]|uniref:alpha/beta fold hydrolase n=1 Tax=Actinomadura sp. B10D3 TaxID=3153557 RepID=UPI00325D2275
MPKSKVGRFTTPAGREVFDAAYEAGLRTLPDPSAVHDVGTAFGTVRAYTFGTAPGSPLVLLHGRGGTAISWKPNIAALAAHRTVHVLDLLGEPGRSVQTEPIRDADDQAAWLAATLEGLDVGAAHLVGVSNGGWSAVNIAVRHPERLASISLLDPINTFARLPLGAILRTIPTLIPFMADWAMPRFLSWVDGRGTVPEGDPVGEVIAAALRHYRMAVPMPALFSDDELRSIDRPVLAVIAGRSVMHDPARAMDRTDLIPHVDAEIWPEATHAVSGQCAEQVNARILRFVEESQNRPSGRDAEPT